MQLEIRYLTPLLLFIFVLALVLLYRTLYVFLNLVLDFLPDSQSRALTFQKKILLFALIIALPK